MLVLTQRLGSDTQKDPEFLNEFIKIVKANPGSCDEVWLSSDYGFPKPETHIKSAEVLADAAKMLRDAGLRVSLQISNTIGHGEYMSSCDCTGLVYENSPVEKMVGHDGTVADYCFCWNGKHFKKYTLSAIKEYVERVKPYCVWVDDDLRATNHHPVEYGCFCEGCINEFNKIYGSSFTREQLVNEINYGDKLWRERHIEFTRNSLSRLVLEMGEVIHKASPESRMGYQYTVNKWLVGYDYNFIFDAMYKSTGYRPLSRPGGGSYNDHDISTFIEKSETIDMQNKMLPDYVLDKRPEIESLPDIVYGKSIAGTCFETSYYLASGNNAMSYAILMNDYETMSWHSEMLKSFSDHRAYWERLSKGSENSQQGGMVYATSKKPYLVDEKGLMDYTLVRLGGVRDFRFLGFSIAMKSKSFDNEVHLLCYENAIQMSNDELTKLLGLPVMTDGETINMLNKRGFSLPIKAENIDTLVLFERFSEHKVNDGIEFRRWGGQFGSSKGFELIEEKSGSLEPLSEYIKVASSNTDEDECVYTANCGVRKFKKINKVASGILTTPLGGRWAVFGFDMWNRNMSSEKRKQYLEVAAYISGQRQPAEIVTPIKALLQSRINEKQELTQVSLTNATAADSGNIIVRINNPKSQQAVLMGQYTEPTQIKLSSVKDCEGLFEVTVPNLKPWAVSTIFFE